MYNQFKRMQKLAGLLTENITEYSSYEYRQITQDVLDHFSNIDSDSSERKQYIQDTYPELSEDDIDTIHMMVGQELNKMIELDEGEAAYEYEKGKEAGEKMSKSKLRKKIREIIIAEMAKEAYVVVIQPEDEEERLYGEYKSEKEANMAADSVRRRYYDDMYPPEIIVMPKSKWGGLNELDGAAVEASDYDPVAEAKKKDEEDIDVEDIDVDTELSDVETGGGEDPEVEHVQDLLNQLQDAAEKMGDEKLLKQIGNTITFFTRQHVAEKPELNEASLEAIERMDGLVSQNSVSMLIRGAQGMIRSLKEEGFDDDDIYDYIVERIKILA